MEPMSVAPSWTTNNDQVPFGAPPSKADRLTFPLCGGAGGGKESVVGS
jgi:hypothetical protein